MTFMTMFMVYGEPVGKGRPRFAKRGNFVSTYTPLKTKTYEDEIRMMARAAMGSS
jgi:Holliday junction resolvase RusA-like endonuclease